MSRYARQILFSDIGEVGQERLSSACVVILGCGALGSIQAEILARAGVGKLKIIDRDVLEESNLQRQALYDEQQVEERLPKVIAALQRLRKINSSIEIEGEIADITSQNIESFIDGADLVLDATDNFETRFVLNDACLKHNIPWIYGACVSSYGLSMNILPQRTPCLRCVFEEMPPPGSLQTCDTAGVIAPIVNVIASIQCTEALKILVGADEDLRPGMLNVDLWDGRFIPVEMKEPRSDCPACQHQQWDYLSGKHSQNTTVLCGRNTVQLMPSQRQSVDLKELAERLKGQGRVTHNPFLVRFEIESSIITVFPDGRALIEGTKKASEARSIYAKWIGA